MSAVTEIDRKAAEDLRVLLADMSGFWFPPGDTGPIAAALAQHRETCELNLLEKIRNSTVRSTPGDRIIAERKSIDMPAAYENRYPRQLPLVVNR